MKDLVRAFLRKNVTVLEIFTALDSKYENVQAVGLLADPKAFQLYFTEVDENITPSREYRYMTVHTDATLTEEGFSGVECRLQNWGKAVEILKYLCETFGGYIQEVIPGEAILVNTGNLDLQQEYSKVQLLENEIFHKLDSDAIPVVLELCQKYKDVWQSTEGESSSTAESIE